MAMSISEKYDSRKRAVALAREIENLSNAPMLQLKIKKTKLDSCNMCKFMYGGFRFGAVFNENNQLKFVSKEGIIIKSGSIFEYAKMIEII